MNETYKYSLPKTSMKLLCPCCGKKSFKQFVDNSGTPFWSEYEGTQFEDDAKKVGRCDRQGKCQYLYSPAEFNQKHGFSRSRNNIKREWTPPPAKPLLPAWKWDDVEASRATRQSYDMQPTLIKYWLSVVRLPPSLLSKVLDDYHIGTTRNNDIIYWYIDEKGKARDGKIMRYKPDGHRDHNVNPRWIWKSELAQNAIIDGRFNKDKYDKMVRELEQKYDTSKPYFGTHLLSMPEYDGYEVGLVEGEKSALICSMLLPQWIWIAMGTNTPNEMRIETAIRQRRKFHLFPDMDQIDKIPDKVAQFSSTLKSLMVVHYDWIRNNAQEAKDDIGDILIRQWMDKVGAIDTPTEAFRSEPATTEVDDVADVNEWRLAEYAHWLPDGALSMFEDMGCKLLEY